MSGTDILNEQEAEQVAASFAAEHSVDREKAQTYARKWFGMGNDYPERKEDALVRALRRHFGLL
ncbi:hypothetical protein [Pandoraea sp. NPDC087047]|uniref:hypothetical protein n=1 Tax=Pandoraea sp. NPDC087047 TaxID=3364390 RepID=UPI0037F5485F